MDEPSLLRFFRNPHGETNRVVMPYVLIWNRTKITDRIEALSSYLRLKGDFDGFLQWILHLSEAISLPHDLRQLGVESGAVETMARMAEIDRASAINPVGVDKDGFEHLYERALVGDLSKG